MEYSRLDDSLSCNFSLPYHISIHTRCSGAIWLYPNVYCLAVDIQLLKSGGLTLHCCLLLLDRLTLHLRWFHQSCLIRRVHHLSICIRLLVTLLIFLHHGHRDLMILFYRRLALHLMDLLLLGLAVRLLHLFIQRLLAHIFKDQHLCLLVTFFAQIMVGLESWLHQLDSHCLGQFTHHFLYEFQVHVWLEANCALLWLWRTGLAIHSLCLYHVIVLLFDDDVVSLRLNIVEVEHRKFKLWCFIWICFDKSLNIRVTSFGLFCLYSKLGLNKLGLRLSFSEQSHGCLHSVLWILTCFGLGGWLAIFPYVSLRFLVLELNRLFLPFNHISSSNLQHLRKNFGHELLLFFLKSSKSTKVWVMIHRSSLSRERCSFELGRLSILTRQRLSGLCTHFLGRHQNRLLILALALASKTVSIHVLTP